MLANDCYYLELTVWVKWSFCVKSFVTLFCKYDILLTFLPPAGFINTYCHHNYSFPTRVCHVSDCDECSAVTVLSVVSG